jgi:hypothetical protein
VQRMLPDKQDHHLAHEPSVLNQRLTRRVTVWELFALALGVGVLGVFIWAFMEWSWGPPDYYVYLQAVKGDLSGFYYADWILPLFSLAAKLPFLVGYAIMGLLSIGCVFFATRLFGGHVSLTLLCYPMMYALYYGQFVGVAIGGLALAWWAMAHRRWHLAGLGFVIAFAKLQFGLTFGLLLWLAADVSWRQRLQILPVPTLVVMLSLVNNPGWPMELLARLQAYPPDQLGNISLWRYLGPLSLLAFVPPLLLPMKPRVRLLALAAAVPLALPYFQQTDLLALFVLPVGWLPAVLSNLGYLHFTYGFHILRVLVVAPLVAYAATILPALVRLVRVRLWPSDLPSGG